MRHDSTEKPQNRKLDTATRALKVRFERSDSTKSRPDYYVEYDVTDAQAQMMVQRDLELRQAAADPGEVVEPRDIQEIVVEEINKPEYNNAKKFHRHTEYRNVAGRGEDADIEYIETATGRIGVIHATDFDDDPSDEWARQIDYRRAVDRLPRRERQVFLAIYELGLTHREVADHFGVSQPMITKIYGRARDRIRKELS